MVAVAGKRRRHDSARGIARAGPDPACQFGVRCLRRWPQGTHNAWAAPRDAQHAKCGCWSRGRHNPTDVAPPAPSGDGDRVIVGAYKWNNAGRGIRGPTFVIAPNDSRSGPQRSSPSPSRRRPHGPFSRSLTIPGKSGQFPTNPGDFLKILVCSQKSAGVPSLAPKFPVMHATRQRGAGVPRRGFTSPAARRASHALARFRRRAMEIQAPREFPAPRRRPAVTPGGSQPSRLNNFLRAGVVALTTRRQTSLDILVRVHYPGASIGGPRSGVIFGSPGRRPWPSSRVFVQGYSSS